MASLKAWSFSVCTFCPLSAFNSCQRKPLAKWRNRQKELSSIPSWNERTKRRSESIEVVKKNYQHFENTNYGCFIFDLFSRIVFAIKTKWKKYDSLVSDVLRLEKLSNYFLLAGIHFLWQNKVSVEWRRTKQLTNSIRKVFKEREISTRKVGRKQRFFRKLQKLTLHSHY